MQLIKNGEIVSLINYKNPTDATTETAISEYSLFLRFCTGKDAACSSVKSDKFENFVIIGGNDELLSEFGIKVPRETFSDDSVYIKVQKNVAVLDGGARGKLYAVYEFLERFLGVRFYAPEAYKCPHIENLEISDCEITYTPKIAFREMYSFDIRWNREFAARLRSNIENVPYGLKHFGGSLSWAKPRSHTSFEVFFPPYDKEVGIEAHPEYYAWRKDQNKRVGRFHDDFGFPWGEGEVCWTNPDVINIMTEKLKKWILNEPEMTVFSVTQNDWGEYCECPECEKIARKYGRDGEPVRSAPVLFAVNQIAKNIKEWQKNDERVKNRKIHIETFAYNYTKIPPVGMKVEDNVIVMFCSSGCRFHKFSENCALNDKLKAEFEEWKKIAKNVYVWEYMANGCMAVSYGTYMKITPERIRYFADHDIIGMFAQYEDQGAIGPLFKANQYLYAKLLWNPETNIEEEYRGFMEYYYGEAAGCLMEVQRRFEETLASLDDKLKEENGTGLHLLGSYMMFPEYYPDEFLQVADSLYKVALSKVSNEEMKLRVKREHWYLKFAKMYKYRGQNYEEMQAVIDEMKDLGIVFDKMKYFIQHYYGGKKDDLFLKSIEDRNRKNDLETVFTITRE